VSYRQLFERTTRSARLTIEGETFLKKILPALAVLGDATSDFKQRKARVRLSVLPSFARFWLVPRLPALHKKLPDITFDIDTTLRKAQLDQDEADIAIRFCLEPSGEGIIVTKLMNDVWLPVASPEYIAQLPGEGQTHWSEAATLIEHQRQPWQPWFEEAGLQTPSGVKTLQLSDTAMMVDAALHGAGVALVRHSLVAGLVAEGRLMAMANTVLSSEFSYFVICKKQSLRKKSIARVHDWLTHSVERDQENAH
jgi:LysR family glycine cleavage system transcriptional activator